MENNVKKIYKAVIFDLDGVICFTDEFHYQAWKYIADQEGIYFDEKINNRLRGVSRMESLDIILELANKEYTFEEKLALAEEKNVIYVKSLEEMSEEDFSVEVKDTLIKLKNKGYLLSIGSSSKNAKKIMERLGCTELFDAISDGTNISKSKPDPEVFLKAAEFLKQNPSECLVVEDAIAGIEAACAGGFDSAGIGEASEFDRTTYKLNVFRDLLNIL